MGKSSIGAVSGRSRRRLLLAVLGAPVAAYALFALFQQYNAERLADWSCADGISGQSVSFCRTMPAPGAEEAQGTLRAEIDAARIAIMATVKGIALETVPMTWGDLWVERAVAASVRNLLARSLDDDLTRITGDFGRQFRTRPKIVTFASAASFEEGLKTLFRYDPMTARSLAQQAGGALILEQRTIVINWAVLGRERPLTILRHELSHAMVRDVAGYKVELPAWFDEGLATLEQSTTPGSERKVEDDLYVATALVSGGRVSLGQLTTQQDFNRQTAALQGRTYAVAAVGVDLVRERAGFAGLATIVKRSLDIGFDAAFRETVGAEVAEFVRRFPEAVAARAPDPSLSTTRLASGDVEWLVRGLAPNTKARATVEGPAGYRLTFDVTVDPFGMYRGSFGVGQPAGAYTLRVEGTTVALQTQFTLSR